MKEQDFLHLMGQIDDKFLDEMTAGYGGESAAFPSCDERRSIAMHVHRKPKHLGRTLLIAAVFAALLTAAALAVGYSIHRQRQMELRSELNIDAAHVESYMEYPVPTSAEAAQQEGAERSIVLLSALRGSAEQTVYVNVAPIEPEAMEEGENGSDFFYYISREVWGVAFRDKYDEESKTLTLRCTLDNSSLNRTMGAEGQTEISFLQVRRDEDTSDYRIFNDWIYAHRDSHSLGSVTVEQTGLAVRQLSFRDNTICAPQSNYTACVLSLELSATDAVWHMRFDGVGEENRDTPEAYLLEDYVTQRARLIFSDGSELCPGGALTSRYEDGEFVISCSWREAVDIQGLKEVYIADTLLEMK